MGKNAQQQPWLLDYFKSAAQKKLKPEECDSSHAKRHMQVVMTRVYDQELWLSITDGAKWIYARVTQARASKLSHGSKTVLKGATFERVVFSLRLDSDADVGYHQREIKLPPKGFFLDLHDFVVYGEASQSFDMPRKLNVNEDAVIRDWSRSVLADRELVDPSGSLMAGFFKVSQSNQSAYGASSEPDADMLGEDEWPPSPKRAAMKRPAALSQSSSGKTAKRIKLSPASSYAGPADGELDEESYSYRPRAPSEAGDLFADLDGADEEGAAMNVESDVFGSVQAISSPAPPKSAPEARSVRPADNDQTPMRATEAPATPSGMSTIKRAPRASLIRAIRLVRPGSTPEELDDVGLEAEAESVLTAFDELPFARPDDVPFTDFDALFPPSPPLETGRARSNSTVIDRATSPTPPKVAPAVSRTRVRMPFDLDDSGDDDEPDVVLDAPYLPTYPGETRISPHSSALRQAANTSALTVPASASTSSSAKSRKPASPVVVVDDDEQSSESFSSDEVFAGGRRRKSSGKALESTAAVAKRAAPTQPAPKARRTAIPSSGSTLARAVHPADTVHLIRSYNQSSLKVDPEWAGSPFWAWVAERHGYSEPMTPLTLRESREALAEIKAEAKRLAEL